MNRILSILLVIGIGSVIYNQYTKVRAEKNKIKIK